MRKESAAASTDLSGAPERDWNRRYDEAMQWRDWQTCDLLLEEREAADWYRKGGRMGYLRPTAIGWSMTDRTPSGAEVQA